MPCIPTNDDCPGCLSSIEDRTAAYNPGCNYGCGWVSYSGQRSTHDLYCSESCFDNSNEAADERAYQDFHAGEGALSVQEQCRRAYLLKG